MKCVIMQPAFFPWAGYFNLIHKSDIFVFLDDVQFEKQSWQNRNRILLDGCTVWITAPVTHRNLHQNIREIEVCNKHPWQSKLLRKLTQGYARHSHRDEMLELATLLEQLQTPFLADINIALIKAACDKLGIVTRFVRSSEIGVSGERSKRLIEICELLGCDEYLSPRGAAEYLAIDRFSERSGVHLSFQNYQPKAYLQPKTEIFASHLSIIDVVSCLGWEKTKQYVV